MSRKAAAETVSDVRVGRPFRILGKEVPRGTFLDLELPVARLPGGAWASMPIRIIHGAVPGPTVWLSAALHGDELNGVIIVRRLSAKIKPKALSGTVLAVPIVNVFGVASGNRYLPDRRDLNRSFPGSPKGSLAARLANHFFTQIASRCDLGFDYHTASNGRVNLPQMRCDLEDPDTRAYAAVFGAPLTIQSALRAGTLRAAANKRGIRVLLFEAGEANRLDPTDIEVGVSGTLRVLSAMGMVPPHLTIPGSASLISRKSKWIRAPRSGFCMMEIGLGQTVRAGDVIATIDDGIGQRSARVAAKEGGMVIGLLRSALVHRGDALAHIAEVGA